MPKIVFIYAFSFVLSFLMLSPFGAERFLNFGGAYIAEIGLVIMLFLLYVYSPRHLILALKYFINPYTLALLVLFISNSLIGIVKHGDVAAAYTDFRSLACLIIASYLSYKYIYNQATTEWLYWTLLFALIFNITYVLISLQTSERESEKFNFPLSAMVLTMLLPFFLKRIKLFAMASIVSLVCAALAFYRTTVVVFILLFVGYLLANILLAHKERAANRLLAWFLSIGALALMAYLAILSNQEYLLSFFMDNESRYIQSVVKWEVLLTYIQGESAIGGGDDIRLYYYKHIVEYFYMFIFPEGLGHKASINYMEHLFAPTIIDGNTLDSTWLFVLYHFGLLQTLGLIAYALHVNKWKIQVPQPGNKLVAFITIGVIIFYSSLTASHLVNISSSISFGILIGFTLRNVFTSKPNPRTSNHLIL